MIKGLLLFIAQILAMIFCAFILVTILSVMGQIAYKGLEEHFRRRGIVVEPKPPETTEEKIQRLMKALRETTVLTDTIESEIKARSLLAENLQKDVEHYNNVSST